ncbi:hypothetical protein SAMN05421781_0327 [Marinococcus luteus]|uniref:Uncharacterized protein n=1 Tax=Marinococcus luteus TaxID=1122204 RepID=A0A1H2QIJ0_9BACI|nr:hypothetical protein [Marinococcus luteus]SDW06730.1 hypothetical protein SAMN05421781_0327 [Marinococcus luteus]
MKRFIDRLHEAARSYSLVDFGVLKLCLFTIGVWTGVSYARVIRPKMRVVQITALASYFYLLYTTIRKMCTDAEK